MLMHMLNSAEGETRENRMAQIADDILDKYIVLSRLWRHGNHDLTVVGREAGADYGVSASEIVEQMSLEALGLWHWLCSHDTHVSDGWISKIEPLPIREILRRLQMRETKFRRLLAEVMEADSAISIMDSTELQEKIADVLEIRQQRLQQPRKPRDLSGYIYLLQSNAGHTKIGKTQKLHERIGQISPKLPFTVDLIHSIKCANRDVAETELHRWFSNQHIHGEWFNLSPEDITWLKTFRDLPADWRLS